jgi:RHS repeat-associated protein
VYEHLSAVSGSGRRLALLGICIGTFAGASGCSSKPSQECAPATCQGLGATCGTISDGCSAQLDCGTCSAPRTCGGGGKANVCGGVPLDPAAVAPAFNPTLPSDIGDGTSFLYSGNDPIQTGVSSGTIDKSRVAVIRGQVSSSDGQPLSEASVAILNHPELGSTLTRPDGNFDIAVNGGGRVTVTFQKAGFLPAHREVSAPVRDYAWSAPVTLVQLDAQVTRVDLSQSAPQLVRGSPVSDQDGSRQAHLLLKPGTQAGLTVNGQSRSLNVLSIRATEYTIGQNGIARMPANLPPETGYTYAVEFSADEGLAAGATAVTFNQPVISYVENFLGMPVGTPVPAGYYDRERGVWVAAPNGRVIQVLNVVDGKAALDVDGDGKADSGAALSGLGIDDVELSQIGSEYAPGTSLWRVPMTHFTPWDYNWPYGPPPDAKPPKNPKPPNNKCQDCQGKTHGSIIGIENQTLGETIPIAGTPYSLVYSSDRTSGWRAGKHLSIPVTGAMVPASVKRVEVDIKVAGQLVRKSLSPSPNQTVEFDWDGKDAYGRPLQGLHPVTVETRYVYRAVYQQAAPWEASFARLSGIPMSTNEARTEIALSQSWTGEVGAWDMRLAKLGGWSIDQAHVYDSSGPRVLFGDGSASTASPLSSAAVLVAGTGNSGSSGDEGPATAADLTVTPVASAIAFGADGAFYFAEPTRIRRVSPNGTITTVAGGGSSGGPGDGGPATSATIASAGFALAINPVDGSIAFTDDFRIRRIRPDGVLEALLGQADLQSCIFQQGDATETDGPAAHFCIVLVSAMAFGRDGALYFSDSSTVKRLGSDGFVSTIAGAGSSLDDGVPATSAGVQGSILGLAVLPSGEVAYLESRSDSSSFGGTSRVRLVGKDGLIQTLATLEGTSEGLGALSVDAAGTLYASVNYRVHRIRGDGIAEHLFGCVSAAAPDTPCTVLVDGLPSYQAILTPGFISPNGVAYAVGQNQIFRISSGMPSYANAAFLVASPDGDELYGFDSSPRHVSTFDALTKATKTSLAYDASGLMTSLTDRNGLKTTIERDSNGQPTAVVSPYGQRTALEINSSGFLTAAVNPAGERTEYTYSADGLMLSMKDARGGLHSFEYDADGRLTKDTDPAGGFKTLARSRPQGANDEFAVTVTTALGRTTTRSVETLAAGAKNYSATGPDGVATTIEVTASGNVTTRTPDGMTLVSQQGPRPPFGMQAPMVVSMTEATPSGLTRKTERTRKVETGSDLYSISTLSEDVTLSDKTWTTQYDASSRTLTKTSPMGRQRTLTFDEKGRVASMEVPGLATSTVAYDEHGRPKTVAQGERTTAFAYDAQGNLSSITDPMSRTTALQSDAVGRLLKQTAPDGSTTEFRYDANSNIVGITPAGRSEYGFEYTPVDLQSSFAPPSVGTWDPATRYSYDKDKALTDVARPDSLNVMTSYDAAGRISKIEHPQGSVTLGYSATTGQLVTAETPHVSLAYGYDGSLLTSATWTGEVAGSVGYVYDNNFRVVSTMVNGANAANRGYDDDGLLTSVGSLSMTRDPSNGLLTGTSVGTGAGKVTESYEYNDFGEVTSYSAKIGRYAVLEIQYTRDALGRIARKVETVDGVTAAYDYGYDAANRLAEVKKDGAVVRSWTYDAAGNRTSATERGATVSATYDAQDRMLSYGTTTYTYGNAGELLTTQRAGEAAPTRYTYDAFGNLVGVSLPDGRQITYVVDAQGRRVGKKVDGLLVQALLWENQLRVATELDGRGNVASRFIHGNKVNLPELMIKGTSTFRIVADPLGNPRLIVDIANGEIAQRIDFDEWGSLASDPSVGFQPFGFSGGLYDTDTGLVQFGARQYESAAARFTQPEPALQDPSTVAQYASLGTPLNPYAYAASNPIQHSDPSGEILPLAVPIVVVLAEAAEAAAVATAAVAVSAMVAKGVSDAWDYIWERGGKEKVTHTDLADLTDEELAERLRKATGKEKIKLQREQKGRGQRNKTKRDGCY